MVSSRTAPLTLSVPVATGVVPATTSRSASAVVFCRGATVVVGAAAAAAADTPAVGEPASLLTCWGFPHATAASANSGTTRKRRVAFISVGLQDGIEWTATSVAAPDSIGTPRGDLRTVCQPLRPIRLWR